MISVTDGKKPKVYYQDEKDKLITLDVEASKYWGCRFRGHNFRFHEGMTLRIFIEGSISAYGYGFTPLRDAQGKAIDAEGFIGHKYNERHP